MDFSAPRYVDTPFPPYRFIPGRFPHPTAHPQGHSYHAPGASPPAVAYRSPHEWRESGDYLYGCDLYNHAYWWEAHEAWEGLWQLTDKKQAQGRFLQGLIQVSACHLKLHVNHLRGVQRLRTSSAAHLRAALETIGEPHFMGLDIPSWLDSVKQYYDDLLARHPQHPQHDPDRYPVIVLQW